MSAGRPVGPNTARNSDRTGTNIVSAAHFECEPNSQACFEFAPSYYSNFIVVFKSIIKYLIFINFRFSIVSMFYLNYFIYLFLLYILCNIFY